MLIQPCRHYVVHCQQRKDILNNDQTIRIWNLIVLPDYKSWNIIDQDIQINTYFFDHFILSIEDITDSKYGSSTIFMNKLMDLEPDWEDGEFTDPNEASVMRYELDINTYYGSSYRCQFCNGVVIDDRCTDCMFDWDS